MSKFVDGIKQSFGFFMGTLIIITILAGVYAFVEPSQGPSAGSNYIDTNSPINDILTRITGSYDSTSVSGDQDGNIFERLEYLISTTPSSSGTIDWSDCHIEYSRVKSSSSSRQTDTISCSPGYELVSHSCGTAGETQSNSESYCRLSSTNSVYIVARSEGEVSGNIKCCRLN